jgi:hypothetical protein
MSVSRMVVIVLAGDGESSESSKGAFLGEGGIGAALKIEALALPRVVQRTAPALRYGLA